MTWTPSCTVTYLLCHWGVNVSLCSATTEDVCRQCVWRSINSRTTTKSLVSVTTYASTCCTCLHCLTLCRCLSVCLSCVCLSVCLSVCWPCCLCLCTAGSRSGSPSSRTQPAVVPAASSRLHSRVPHTANRQTSPTRLYGISQQQLSNL